MLNVFIGWDSREIPAYNVAKHSIQARCSVPVKIHPIIRKSLGWAGLYTRTHTVRDGRSYDDIDGRPFATEFSFTRFLTPGLAQRLGIKDRVLFVDCDFLFLADIAELFEQDMQGAPVAVVKHDFTPVNATKMDGQAQQAYPCKLWSSLMLFDLSKEFPGLTDHAVNSMPGSWLHQFKWADTVGELPKEWNFIPEFSTGTPKAVHYTEGVPIFDGYEKKPWAREWLEESDRIKGSIPFVD